MTFPSHLRNVLNPWRHVEELLPTQKQNLPLVFYNTKYILITYTEFTVLPLKIVQITKYFKIHKLLL